MATLTGKKVSDTYKDLLQVSNNNTGIDATLRTVEDGEGTSSVLQVSSTAVNISSDGALQLNSTAITATGTEINYLDGADGNINTLVLPASTTISTFGASLIDDADASSARTTLGLGTISTLNTIDISDNTNLIAGSDITLDNDTLNVDDSFLRNDGDDETTGKLTATEFIGDLRGAVRFRAKADVNLTKGDAVYVSGIDGNTPTVGLADANDVSKMPSFGLAANTVSANANVEIVTFGTLSSVDTDTPAFDAGDVLYISTTGTTGNTLTNTAPTGESSYIQNIGTVERRHASAGSIKVGGAGRFNATGNLNDGNIFIGNASNQSTTASLNTKVEEYLDGGTSSPDFASLSIGGTAVSSFGISLIDDADASAARTTLGVDAAGTDNSTDVSIAAGKDYITINESTQVITLGSVDLTTDVTGTLPVANGGTGATTLNNLITLGTHTTGNYVSTISGTTNEIEVSGSGSETAAVTIGLPDNVTIAGTLTVESGLIVNGATTNIDTTNLVVEDPLIKLAKNNDADSLDIGFYGTYYDGGAKYTGLFRDANDSGKFKLFSGVNQAEPGTTVNTSDTGYTTATLVANLEGNASSATTLTNLTASVSELNVLDGYTGSVTELNYLDSLHGTGVTSTQFGYLSGASSNIQLQLDDKADASHSHTLDSLSNVTITSNGSGEILKWNGTAWINNTLSEAGIQPAGTYLDTSTTFGGDVEGTYNNITVKDNLHNHTLSNISDITASATELNYSTGVTSSIQTQLNAKQNALTALTTSTSFSGDVSGTYNNLQIGSNTITTTELNVSGAGTSGQVLSSNALGGFNWIDLDFIEELAQFGGDVSGTYDNITVKDNLHNHTVSNISDITTASTGITSVGTITTGVWNGTAIADAYIASASNWNTAYGWGDHSTAGYIEDGDFASSGLMKRGATSGSYSIITDNSSNWNTAYSWGDHAVQNYMDTSTSFTGDVSGTYNTLDIQSDTVGTDELKVTGYGTTTQFLRSDGDGTFSWAVPTDTNTTYSNGTGLDLTGTVFSIDSTVVTLTGTQTLSNKTFVSPALGTPASGLMTNVSGTALNLTAGKVVVDDSIANTNFPVVFHNESNQLLDDTGALRYNPSTGTLLVPNLVVAGTTTTVDTVTMEAANAIKFEGATADANETILSIVDPTNDDNTQYLLDASGYIPLLAVNTTTQITATPEELNKLDGYTGSVTELNYLDSLHATGVTATEFDYLDGVTSNIQTQLNSKQASGSYLDTSTVFGGDVSGTYNAISIDANVIGANELNVTGNGTTTQFLRSDGDGSFSWATPTDTNTVTTNIAGTGITVSSGTGNSTIAINATSYANWNTAYGWGDHSTAGYSTGAVDTITNNTDHYILTATGITDTINGESGLTYNGSTLAVSGNITATGGNSGNWNTAYGWGNHASAGYLTSSSGLNGSNITSGTVASAYLDADTAHLSGTQTFSGAKTFSAGINMNNTNITGVNALVFADPGPGEGLSWSNFAIYESPNDLTTNSAGNVQFVSGGTRRATVDTSGNLYVQNNITLGGTITASGGNSSNWNTAYGWGNHATQGYATSLSDFLVSATAVELNVLDGITASTAELNFTDGVTSNIQTQLNGKQPVGSYLTSSSSLNASNLTSGTVNTARLNIPSSANWFSGGATVVGLDGVMEVGRYIDFHNTDTTTSDYNIRLDCESASVLNVAGGTLEVGGSRVLTVADEGSGNGIDADTLDGLHGSSYWTKSGSWVGDLASNGWTRVQGVASSGGEFVLAQKSAQMSTLIDGSYFAYEAGGFWSSVNSAYGNATGFQATGSDTITVKQADGGRGDIVVTGQVYGGFGALTTGGTADWNHSSNARAGNGYTLLLGNATNGHNFDTNYYHTLGFEYISKDGSGNVTQLAMPYTGGTIAFRSRYGGTWGTWYKVLTSADYTNGSNNRILTSTGSTGINGEGNLTFDGTDLFVNHSSGSVVLAATHAYDKIKLYGSSGHEQIGTEGSTLVLTASNWKMRDYSTGTTMYSFPSNGKLYAAGAVQAGNAGIEVYDATHGFKQILGKDSTYTYLRNNDGGYGIYIGDLGDAQNYYDSGAHRFRNYGGGTTYAVISSTGLAVTGAITATGDVTAYYSSDKRLKDNIKPIDNAIDKVQQLGGYEFDWNDKQDLYTGHDIGVIAQEVEEVLPELVTTREDGYKAVKYEKMVALLIEAVKEQQQQINELKEQLNG